MRLARCFRAECLKLLTRPSLPLTVAGVLAAGIALAWLETPAVLQVMLSGDPGLAPGVDFENMGFDMVSACQLGMVVVGAMAASGEYEGSGLRASLLAMPSRTVLFAAQAAALALFCLVAATVSVVASALISFSLTHVFRSVVVPLFAMVCLSLSTYAALSLTALARFLPTTAGVLLFDPLSITVSYPDAAMSRPQAALVVAVWALVVGCLAAVLFARRPSR